jgi:hypothetical protein
MYLLLVLLLGTILAWPLPLNAQTADGLGMWVWSSAAFATREARQKLVHFCVQNHISHLDVHAKISGEGKTPTLENQGAFKDLILEASQSKITIAILRGDPRMFFAQKQEQTLNELRAIIAFSETLPQGVLLKGIKYDVEPYATKEWKARGEPRRAVMHDYLTFLRKARAVLQEEAPHLWLAVDTPFWWDQDEFILEFEGMTLRFSEHVQNLTDFIVILSYGRDPEKVLASVEGERKYAERIEKLVHPSLETIKLKEDPSISFWGVPAEEFWKTVNQIQKAAKSDPALGGVMIHNYRGLAEKLKENTSVNMDAGPVK